MHAPTKEYILKLLSGHIDTVSNNPISEIVRDLVIKESKAYFAIPCTKQTLPHYTELANQIKTLLAKNNIEALISFVNKTESSKQTVAGVKKVIIVASGKGGVGKSVCAFNMAIALANAGARVGLVDVDIYGPSLPQLSGIKDKPVVEDAMVAPHQKFGISMMSVGYLIDSEDALIWRGPMTSKMLFQLIRQTKWDNLDYLIIDTPPGTGDIHLSLYEQYPIDGVIVITTPQKMVIADVLRALNMYKKFEIPLVGIVQNFSGIEGVDANIFGDGAENTVLAEKYNAGFLEQMPIYQELNEASDTGRPIPYYSHKSVVAKKFEEIAKNVLRYFKNGV